VALAHDPCVLQTTPHKGWPSELPDGAFGLPPADTHVGLQQDATKELVNKLAWVIGSTYRIPYGNARSPARSYAWRIVKALLRDNGYPGKIGINAPERTD